MLDQSQIGPGLPTPDEAAGTDDTQAQGRVEYANQRLVWRDPYWIRDIPTSGVAGDIVEGARCLQTRIEDLEREVERLRARQGEGEPKSESRVRRIADHQANPNRHPWTCGQRGGHPMRHGDSGVLYPALTPDLKVVLVCPDCDYVQELDDEPPAEPDCA